MLRSTSLSRNVNVMKIRPTFLFVLFTLLFICSVNFRFWSNVTPISFSGVTIWTFTSPLIVCIVYSKFMSGYQYVVVYIFENGSSCPISVPSQWHCQG